MEWCNQVYRPKLYDSGADVDDWTYKPTFGLFVHFFWEVQFLLCHINFLYMFTTSNCNRTAILVQDWFGVSASRSRWSYVNTVIKACLPHNWHWRDQVKGLHNYKAWEFFEEIWDSDAGFWYVAFR